MTGRIVILLGVTMFWTANCIVSKTDSDRDLDNIELKKRENPSAESIDRDYVAGPEDDYGRGGYGLSAHASFSIPEGYEIHGGYEGGKHHGHHHREDHHLHHHHHHTHHKHHDSGFHKSLAIKGLLVPLAGVALLGAAAAFVSNPILLQLGVVSGSALGRRKREAMIPDSALREQPTEISSEDRIRLEKIKLLEKFMTQVPKEQVENQEEKMLADYLRCSEATTPTTAERGSCLERLVCELHSSEGISMPTESDALAIVVNEILSNRFVPAETKLRISKAAEKGRRNAGCSVYECRDLDIAEEEDDGPR